MNRLLLKGNIYSKIQKCFVFFVEIGLLYAAILSIEILHLLPGCILTQNFSLPTFERLLKFRLLGDNCTYCSSNG